MILDQFWKIIFIILLGIGFSFWWKMKKSDKAHSFLIDELGELITTEIKSASANADKKAQESFYKSIEIIRQIEEIIGEDFEINQVISEAIETSDAPESFPRHEVADAFEINYILSLIHI